MFYFVGLIVVTLAGEYALYRVAWKSIRHAQPPYASGSRWLKVLRGLQLTDASYWAV